MTDAHEATPDDRRPDDEIPMLDLEMLPEVVSDLARTSELHDGQLAGLRTRVGGHDDRLRELDSTVTTLAEGMAEAVDLTRPSRWSWPFLDREEAAALWRETRWFVDYLITRYPLSTELSIPPCWYRHTVAVDEMSDLYAAWREAYFNGDRPSSALINWRDRWLWPALNRLTTTADWRECKATKEHVEPAARQDRTDVGFETFVAEDLAGRPEARSPRLPWSPADVTPSSPPPDGRTDQPAT